MEAAWACTVDRAAHMADSARRFFLSFRRPQQQQPPPPPPPSPNPAVDILKRLQRQAFYDILQLRERQEKVERVLSLFKASKVGPFAEESTQVKGVINVAGSLSRDSSEAESGAKCDDFSDDPNLREGHWLASLHSSLRPPLLIRSHKYAGGLILRSKNFAVSLAELISVAGKPLNAGEANSVFTEFGQFSYQMPDDIKLTLSAACHGPSVIPQKRKPTAGGCIDVELKIDEDSRIGAWIEINRKSNPRLPRWALTLSDTPEDDLGWGLSLRRGTDAKPQRFQVEGFLNLHLGKKAAVQPGIVFNVDGRRCTPALVFHSSWSL
ncbi:hypothetical protein C2845_PM10G21590 [Panicum miliaceum]|uniref:Uncharacterized protein n=1 Tax=Panicum miliaceum TaxID=4540 RepID=A0A3L6PA54_PANMI|nr:hypothetical protein C2845_PM10G21590 [Panicum miliaceum]